MKGFITVISILAVFLVSIILLNISYQEYETMSFKEEILNEKIIFVNYELAMNRGMKGYDLTKANLDGNSQAILDIITSGFNECTANVIETSRTANRAEVRLQCITDISIRGETVFLNTMTKTIVVAS